MSIVEEYEVIIVGGGITGASLLYLLSRYSAVRSILLVEKYGDLAQLNSNSSNNAQTLHFGDIETNYSIEQSRHVLSAARMVLRYTQRLPYEKRSTIIRKCQKMVLAVGETEISSIERNYDSGLKEAFPGLRQIWKKELERIEPNTTKKRDPNEKLSALLSDNGHMVDFGRLTHSFVENTQRRMAKIRVIFNTKVISISGSDGEYKLKTNNGDYRARFVVFAAGTYSLFFAKSLGYDKNLSVLSVGGSFYEAPSILRGKVYRVQIGGIPFAAVHGDPDFNGQATRFGPTVTLPLTLEKGHPETFIDYLRTFDFDIETMVSLKRIMFSRDINRILLKNLLYGVPGIGKHYFLKMEAAKIVPSLRHSDLTLGKIGGIRPQIIDERKKALVLGASKIKEEGLIFNITPSPGASSCLQAALEDVLTITGHLGVAFDLKKFEKELGKITEKNILSLF